MDAFPNKGDSSVNYLFSRVKEEEDMDSSYTDNSGQDLSTHSDAFDHIKTEDSSNSYGSVKEERDTKKQGDLVYDPDTLLRIMRVDEADFTTDDDSEAKEPLVNSASSRKGQLKTGSTSGIADKVARRRPRFTASEEFVLVTEMLEHYDILFGELARVTPFAQKVLIWQKVLDNVNSVGVVPRGIEEAKKHWHLYRHKLMEKLASIRKHGSDSGHPLFLQLSPLESKVASLFKLEYMLRSPQYALENHQGSIDLASDCAQNGTNTPEQGSLGQGDFLHSKAPRNVKFSFDENCALVHEAVSVWDSIVGHNAATTSQVRKNQIWSQIVEAVNAAGTQPRSIENCKKRLRDIKRRVKAKMADQHKYVQRNGGNGPGLELQYLSYEEELMHVLGPDTIRPVEGHVDTDREPCSFSYPLPAIMGISSYASAGQKSEGKSEPDETCDDDEFWNHSSFDMAEEDEEEEKETIVKIEPIDYSTDTKPALEQQLPAVTQPITTHISVSSPNIPSSTKPSVVATKATFLLSKSPTAGTKPPPTCAKPPFVSNKSLAIPIKPPPAVQQPSYPGAAPGHQPSFPGATPACQPSHLGASPGYQPSYPGATPGYQPNVPNTDSINKVVGTFHSAQHNYHRAQRHQMHVIHMDLLHLSSGLQKLTRNVKVNNHVRATSITREFRLKQKDIEDQRQYRQEKLQLLKKHHETKQKLLKQHFDRKERLMEENNHILQKILQRLSTSTVLPPPEEDDAVSLSLPAYDGPSPLPQNSVRTLTPKGVRKRGGRGRGGT